MEAEIDASAVMIGDFNTPPSVTDNRCIGNRQGHTQTTTPAKYARSTFAEHSKRRAEATLSLLNVHTKMDHVTCIKQGSIYLKELAIHKV